MLLEFRVRNYRALRDEQVLSLVASSGDQHLASSHLHATGLATKGLTHVVRSAVVYGANASGKSTLLMALNYMRMVVLESAAVVQPGQAYRVQPFKLDEHYAHEPTSFELSFLMNGIRHEYAFAMRPDRIVSESLHVYPSQKPALIFKRSLDANGLEVYLFGASLKGSKTTWQKNTRANALFLSTSALLNSEELGAVFRYITQMLVFVPAGAMVGYDQTTAMLSTEDGRQTVRNLLAQADIAIADVQAVPRKGAQQEIMFGADGLVQSRQVEGEFLVPLFEHRTSKGSASFEITDESRGTQHLFGMIAPLIDVLKQGRMLVVDELDSSLHTLLVRQLVQMFHGADNKSGAQLLFTTHDTALLDADLFRRDQIWLTEKGADQAARVYPLTDFSPRNTEALERNYLAGRYGGIPLLPRSPQPSLL
jgi:uncharacterized protein